MHNYQIQHFNGQWVAKEVQSDANPTGVVTWLHSDPLGSATLATNASGQPLAGSETRYSPFGSVRFGGAGLPHDRRFNGNTTDIAGLLDFGARAYDPLIGRFVSADTIVPNSADPQTLNRFAFVTNNPLKYNDPTGHQGSCVLTGSCPSPFFGGREGAELVGYLIGLGYVTGNAIAAADNTLSTPLNVAPAAPNNTADTTPNIQQPLVLADPNTAVAGTGVVESYPASPEAGNLQLTTPLDGSSTLQLTGPLTAKTTDRPGGYRKGVRETVENTATTNPNGERICWGCGQPMPVAQLDHHPPIFKRIVERVFQTRKSFLDDYNNPKELRPLCPACNASHKFENTSTEDLPFHPRN